MSVSHAEFVAFKVETADRLTKVEGAVLKTMEDMQKAAPWSVSVETAVAASEAKAEAASEKVWSRHKGASRSSARNCASSKPAT